MDDAKNGGLRPTATLTRYDGAREAAWIEAAHKPEASAEIEPERETIEVQQTNEGP
jgi:hypothetical protein